MSADTQQPRASSPDQQPEIFVDAATFDAALADLQQQYPLADAVRLAYEQAIVPVLAQQNN
ncbi:MAG: hypothetical protein HYS86_05545 [Candidatus Chisholmbacteria bacterium]|nr:hypothetical protein [Candidatus Chisholmbacteria bacterium]